MGIDDVLLDLDKTASEPNPADIPPSDEMDDDGAPPPPPAEPAEVPLAALKEERARRQELQNRIATMETRFSQMMEGYNQLAQARSQAQAAPEPEPVDYEDAPLDYLKTQLEAVTSKLEALANGTQQQAQRSSLQEFQNTVDRAEKAFAAQTPDYMDALAHIENRRTQELTALGYPPDAIKQIVTNDAAQLVQLAINQGKNPAEFAYNFAKSVGFAGKGPAPAPAPAPRDRSGYPQ